MICTNNGTKYGTIQITIQLQSWVFFEISFDFMRSKVSSPTKKFHQKIRWNFRRLDAVLAENTMTVPGKILIAEPNGDIVSTSTGVPIFDIIEQGWIFLWKFLHRMLSIWNFYRVSYSRVNITSTNETWIEAVSHLEWLIVMEQRISESSRQFSLFIHLFVAQNIDKNYWIFDFW